MPTLRHALLLLLLAACAPGPGRPHPAPTTDTFGGDRPVKLLVPDDYDHEKPAPLVVLLHGYGASGFLQGAYLGIDQLPNEAGALVAAPDGTKGADGSRFWNATDACCDLDGAGVDDVAYLTGLVRAISAEYLVDPRRVYLVGHSNGGFMSYRLACEHPELFAAVVSLAGATFQDAARCRPSSPVSVLQIHGDADQTVLYEGWRPDGDVRLAAPYPGAQGTVERWAANNGCTGALEPYGEALDLDVAVSGAETARRRTAGCPAGIDAELWTLRGSGHIPGMQPEFREHVWNWLAAHPRR